jgi:hypothetical protein
MNERSMHRCIKLPYDGTEIEFGSAITITGVAVIGLLV